MKLPEEREEEARVDMVTAPIASFVPRIPTDLLIIE
jgi:hypothetical protein